MKFVNLPCHFFALFLNMEPFDFSDVFDKFDDEEDLLDNNSQFSSQSLQLADDSITNNLPLLDVMQPPSPVFLNNSVTNTNNAIYFKDYKLLRDFIRSNKDLCSNYFILLPLNNFGTLRYDPRQTLKPAVLIRSDLIK